MTKRKPLAWYDTALGPMPACDDCLERLTAPMFVEAVCSVAIEHPTSAAELARRAINQWHANRHRD